MEKREGSSKPKGFYITLWGLMIMVAIAGMGWALTTVTDKQVITPSVNATDILFMQRLGYNNVAHTRVFSSNNSVVANVCPSGCTYSTIQAAVNEIPLINNVDYLINVSAGNYNENVVIPLIISSHFSSQEGDESQNVHLFGAPGNPTLVNITSLITEGGIGNIVFQIKDINFKGPNPYDNENASLGLYGIREIELVNVSFHGNTAQRGLVCYSSTCQLNNVDFGTNVLDYGAVPKHNAMISENPAYGFGTKGTLRSYVYWLQNGIVFYQSATSTATGSTGFVLEGRGMAVDTDTNAFAYPIGVISDINDPRPEIYIETQGDVSANSPTIYLNNTESSVNSADDLGRIIFGSADASSNGQGDAGGIKVIAENSGTSYGLAFFSKRDVEGMAERARFDARGVFLLARNSSAFTCDVSTAGGIYWNNNTFKHYGCNSTTWNALY